MNCAMTARAILLATTALLLASCARHNAVIEIPDGYVGWVTIRYDAADCPPGRSTATESAVSVNEQGFGCSSTMDFDGLAIVRYYYVDEHGTRRRELKSTGWGEGGELWAASSTPAAKLRYIFVGSEAAFNAKKTGPPQPPAPQQRP